MTMDELKKALARREALQAAFEFVMITGKLLLVARDQHAQLAVDLERSALIMLRFVIDSTDRVRRPTGQKHIIRALMAAQHAEAALLALKENHLLRVLADASLEALERAMASLRQEIL
jgi:hypothetical protein